MDDFAGGVKRAFRFAVGHFEQVLEHLAEHFGVYGHFFFERLFFPNGEIVAVEDIKDACAVFVLGVAAVGEEGVGQGEGCTASHSCAWVQRGRR